MFSSTTGSRRKTGSGSGFWVADEGGIAVFITNRHVVDMAYRDSKYVGEGYRLSRLTISSHSALPRNRGVVVDLEGDIDIRVHMSYGVDIAILIPHASDRRTPPLTIPASMLLADQSFFEHLPWGAQVSFASFQAWRDSTTQKPILRTGIVSSDPQDDYSSDIVDRKSALLLEAFSFSGSSGSPLFANAFGFPIDETLLTGGPQFSRGSSHWNRVRPHPQQGGRDRCAFYARGPVLLSQVDRVARNAQPTRLSRAAPRRLITTVGGRIEDQSG